MVLFSCEKILYRSSVRKGEHMEQKEGKKANYDYMIGDVVVEMTSKEPPKENTRFDAYKKALQES